MTKQQTPPETTPADSLPDSWVYRHAPAAMVPYLQLMRADRPIGVWLLLWPCLWSTALAAHWSGAGWRFGLPYPEFLLLFAVGAYIMRGAGCVVNDLADRNFDGMVERTRGRPLPSGRVSVSQAFLFLAALGLIGLLILLQFNPFTIGLGVASLLLVVTYPFMKRVTYWPQFFLGLTFNWGALMGWAAVTGNLGAPAAALYLGGIFWTLGYDTIYAHQDKEDDMLIGVKSLALRLGRGTPGWLLLFYGATAALFTLAGGLAGLGAGFYGGMLLAAGHLLWQVRRLDIDDNALCLRLFKSNKSFGLIVFLSLLAGHYF